VGGWVSNILPGLFVERRGKGKKKKKKGGRGVGSVFAKEATGAVWMVPGHESLGQQVGLRGGEGGVEGGEHVSNGGRPGKTQGDRVSSVAGSEKRGIGVSLREGFPRPKGGRGGEAVDKFQGDYHDIPRGGEGRGVTVGSGKLSRGATLTAQSLNKGAGGEGR